MKNGSKWITVLGFVFILFMLTVDIAYNPTNYTNQKNPVGAIQKEILAESDVDSDMDGWSDDYELYTIYTDPEVPGPFYIDGDAELASMAAYHGWDGDGSEEWPYIIENYYIDVDDVDVSCIEIRNIDSTYFIIRDCEVTGASGPYANEYPDIPFIYARAGIYLYNVYYAEVTNNLVYGNCYGIRIDESFAVVVAENTCYLNNWEGIAVILGSTYCIVTDNVCFENIDGIGYLGNGIGVGVWSYYNLIVHNLVFDNEGSGINFFWGYDNIVRENEFYGNFEWGIAVRGESSGNQILDNLCWENYQGIYLENSDYNTISENTLTDNIEDGIAIVYASDWNTITDNLCIGSNAGIGVGYGSSGNYISENTCTNNYDGIEILGSGNTVEGNLLMKNGVGIHLIGSPLNIVFHNSIIDNTVQALDEDPVSGNFWYNPEIKEGNYWSDYIGVDSNHDGIGDTDVPWPGEGYDLYPLMIPTTLQEMIEVIKSKLHDLVDSGVLEENDVRPLTKKLDAAIDLIDKGKMFQASQKLGDVIDQINALINSGRLPVVEGEDFIAQSQRIIDALLSI
ncbi:MAG: nitrous oxide reductase family maturation protein NosD [Promethearchaeota archaeon]